MKLAPTICCLCFAIASASGADPLATVSGFAPSITITETVTDALVTIPSGEPGVPGFRELVTTTKTGFSLTANITGINLAEVGPDTPFSVQIGGYTQSGALGDDPAYTESNRAIKKSIFIASTFDPITGEPRKSGNGLKLAWTATRLTITGTFASTDDVPITMVGGDAYAGLPATKIRDIFEVSVTFGDHISVIPRNGYGSGSSSVTRRVFGSEAAGTLEEWFLNSVTYSAAFDLAAPTLTISSPKTPFTNPTAGGSVEILGKVGDGHQLPIVEFSTVDPEYNSWVAVTDVDPLPPILPAEQNWGQQSFAFRFDTDSLPAGTTIVWVRTRDVSGNTAKAVAVTIRSAVPPLVAGRWDGVLDPAYDEPEAAASFATFTCTTTGAISGKLTLEGVTSPISFTGIWSGTSFSVIIARTGKAPLSFDGSLGATVPLDLADMVSPAAVASRNRMEDSTVLESAVSVGVIRRCPWSSTNKLPTSSPYLGRFHYGNEDSEYLGPPNVGNCYFAAVVSNTGAVTLTGKTADGTALTGATTVAAGGIIPVYFPLYSGKGCYFASPMLSDQTLADVFTWRRPPGYSDKQYPAGLSLPLSLVGCRYTAPTANSRIMLLDGVLVPEFAIRGDGVAGELVQKFTVSTKNIIAPLAPITPGFTATVDAAKGLISGSFNLSGTTTKAAYSALIVGSAASADKPRAYGYYIAPALPRTTAKRYGGVVVRIP